MERIGSDNHESESGSDVLSESFDPEIDFDPEADSDLEIDFDPETDSDLETDSDSETDLDSNTDPETDLDSKVELRDLYYSESRYVVTIKATKYKTTNPRRLYHIKTPMVNLYECICGTVTGIFDISENREVNMTFPASNNDQIDIVRKGDSVINIGECFGLFRLAMFKQILNRDINHRFTGFATSYDTNYGTKLEECEFKDGVRNGTYNKYDEGNEQLVIKTGNYLNGKKDGEWVYFIKRNHRIVRYFKGNIISVREMYRKIKIFSDKIIFSIGSNKDYGKTTLETLNEGEFGQSSDIIDHDLFKIGIWEFVRKIPRMYSICYITKTRKNHKGDIILIERFKTVEGKKEGPLELWYRDGNKKRVQNYVNGSLDGLLESWYHDGTKKYVIHYVNGVLHGRTEAWYKNGKIRCTKYYVNGESEGKRIKEKKRKNI